MEAEIWSPQNLNLRCPRCNSEETKFGYYNNNQISQPRYRCKNCKKFWTHGGKVRDISSNGRERRVNRFRDSSPSTVSSAPPPPPLPVGMTSGGFINGIWTLNLARPPPTPNQPQLKFVPMDIENLSITKPLEPPSHALGHNNLIFEPNQQIPTTHTFRNNDPMGGSAGGSSGSSSRSWYNAPVRHYIEHNKSHTFGYNNNLMSGSGGNPSGSSSGTWSSTPPGNYIVPNNVWINNNHPMGGSTSGPSSSSSLTWFSAPSRPHIEPNHAPTFENNLIGGSASRPSDSFFGAWSSY
ncbi:hypothetical protein ACET3Z_030984 [Daucus carota]